MRHGRLLKADNKSCIIPNVCKTTNFLERMRGLLFRPQLKEDEAMLITPCGSVHTIGMRYPIDVVFVDRDWTIIKAVPDVKPWRSASCLKAQMVLEMISGSINKWRLSDGQQLEWVDENTL